MAPPPVLVPEPTEALPDLDIQGQQGLLQWISSVDHKQIGIMYLWMAGLFFLVGGIEILLIRLQLAVPRGTLIGPDAYNQLFTMHGTTMIFFVAMPAIFGFANYLVPLMIGANELAFPRLNALALWLTFFGGLLLYFSFLAGGAPDTGWFSYAPLNQYFYSFKPGVDYFCVGLLLAGIGTVGSSCNLAVTILRMRVPGMGFKQMPVFVWMILINSFLIIFSFPALNAALVALLFDRRLHGHFFDPHAGGSAVLWQHLFWLFGHPEVYVLILPAFGIISEVVPVFSRKPLFGYAFVVGSGIAIGLLAFGVWAHHMFAVGMGNTVNGFFSATSMFIGVPTGIKVFNWLATMHNGKLRFTPAMKLTSAFLLEFTIGGLSGIAFAITPIDLQLTDTYFVVAHIHYVFVGGTLFGLLAGLLYWFPKMSGRLLDERLNNWFFWLWVVGFNVTFLVQHALGTLGMPRRVYTYPDLPGWMTLNLISTGGAFLMGVAVLVLAYNIFWALRHGHAAPSDPWDANTLEWSVASPPPLQNFDRVTPVRSARPWRDLKRPLDADYIKPGKKQGYHEREQAVD